MSCTLISPHQGYISVNPGAPWPFLPRHNKLSYQTLNPSITIIIMVIIIIGIIIIVILIIVNIIIVIIINIIKIKKRKRALNKNEIYILITAALVLP